MDKKRLTPEQKAPLLSRTRGGLSQGKVERLYEDVLTGIVGRDKFWYLINAACITLCDEAAEAGRREGYAKGYAAGQEDARRSPYHDMGR